MNIAKSSLIVLTLLCLAVQDARATLFAGLWRSGSDANYFSVGRSLSSFVELANQRHQQNLRLIQIRTYEENGQRKWAGIWRTGTDANYFSVDLTLSEFSALATERHGNGLRLVDIESYLVNGQRRWAGVWRSGTYANYFSVDKTLSEFNAIATDRHKQGLRLVDIETYMVGTSRRWAGLWRTGNYANYYSVDRTLSEFVTLANQRHQENLRLIDLETYTVNGQRKWAGLWESGTDANYFTVGMDIEKFVSLAHDRHQSGLRLIGMNIYDDGCDDGCLNQVVMPEGSYNYGITATPTHCEGEPGTCTSPAAGANVVYRWPVNVEGANRYVRLSALAVPDRFLTLPFSDTAVKRRGIWRYGDGGWHFAGDYSRDDVGTFRVLASAPGKVIHIGWDNWSGNTIVVSHDVGGVKDAYRTIYMHLRNGPSADGNAAWSQTVPWMMGNADLADEMADYIAHLNATGCPQDAAARNPDPVHWGTESQRIDTTLLGQNVVRGQALAWAGNTGPGGKRGLGGANTHLHIFWCRRDPTDNRWYFFDPYGIYALPDCYPPNVTDPIDTPCARYPIAWKDGRPQYPGAVLRFAKLSKVLEFSWDGLGSRLEFSLSPMGPWRPLADATSPYRVKVESFPKAFFRLQTEEAGVPSGR